MRPLFLTAAAFSVVLTSAALAETRSYDLPAFDSVRIASGITAHVTVGDAQSVVAEIDNPDHFEWLDLDVRNGQFRATIDRPLLSIPFLDSINITLHITVPALVGADASSGADVTATGMAGETLTANASSGANLTLEELAGGQVNLNSSSGANLHAAGACTGVTASTSSGARLCAAALICETAEAQASSGARAEVHASHEVTGNASSGGQVSVFGDPPRSRVGTSSGGAVSFGEAGSFFGLFGC